MIPIIPFNRAAKISISLIIAPLFLIFCFGKSAFGSEEEIYSSKLTTDRTFINWDSIEIKTVLKAVSKPLPDSPRVIVLEIEVLETALAQDFGKELIFSDSKRLDEFTISDEGQILLATEGGSLIHCGHTKGKNQDKLSIDSKRCGLKSAIEWVLEKADPDLKKVPVLKVYAVTDH